MTTNHSVAPILMLFLLIIVAVLNLYFPAILSTVILVVGGFLSYSLYRLNQE
jgi:peptidoglycan/LPS O-acetylase OafA/YrhL